MIYHGNEPSNHRGSIVKWPKLKRPETPLGIMDYSTGERNEVKEWREDILLEPVDGQIIVSLEYGVSILSSGEYPLVEITEADLWDEQCEIRYKQLIDEARLKLKQL